MENIDDYQKWTRTTAVFPQHAAFLYISNGLFAEAGEIAGAIAKYHRGDYNWKELDAKLQKELGDCFWFLAQFCDFLGLNASMILQKNVDKLESRKERNVLKGSGDDR